MQPLQMFHKHVPHIIRVTMGPFLRDLHMDTEVLNSNDLCRIERGLFRLCLLGINCSFTAWKEMV